MSTTTRNLIGFVLAAFLFIGAACRGGENAAPQGEVVVYVAVPLSGFQANAGQTVLGGVRLAAEEINRTGGLLGRAVVVRPLDDESDSDIALQQVGQIEEALRNGDQVIGVIGHLNSGQTLSAMERYQSMPLTVITPTASEQSLTERGYRNFFRINANDALQAEVDAAFMVDRLGAKRVAILHNNTEYGRGLATATAAELAERSAIVVLTLEVTEGQSQYSEQVQQIKQAAPDAIFYAGYEIEAPYLRAALAADKNETPFLASDGAFLAATIDEANGTANGMYVSAFAPSPRNAANPQWFEAYQAVEYRNPDTYSINGYVAMQVLAAGARIAGSFDRDALGDALRSNEVDTLLNGLHFEPNGDLANAKIWIYQVISGEFQQVQ